MIKDSYVLKFLDLDEKDQYTEKCFKCRNAGLDKKRTINSRKSSNYQEQII
jgi:hypothetical protein